MKILLDTHVLLWFLEGNTLLSTHRRAITIDARNLVYVSVASLWELAIKLSIGKITLAFTLNQLVGELGKNNIQLLPVSAEHAIKVKDLPFHHRDPFDRLLVAAASCDGLNIMTDDGFIKLYSIAVT